MGFLVPNIFRKQILILILYCIYAQHDILYML